MAGSSIEHQIAGAYQIDALLDGRAFQRAWHRARLDLVAHLLPPTAGLRTLDAAAGSGILSWRFPSAGIVSTDLRLSACHAVRTHKPVAQAVAAELGTLPFRSASFDRLYLLEALEHLTRAAGQQALADLRRVARPGARFLLTTPNYHSYWVALERLLDMFHLTPPMADGQHLCQYHAGSLGRALESTGWTLERLGSFNLVAPIVGIVSPRLAARTIGLETAGRGRLGALLFALCTASA